MILELIEEIKPSTGTMYAVVKDGLIVKWFFNKDSAITYYNEVVANPAILNDTRNILQSQEIDVSLEK